MENETNNEIPNWSEVYGAPLEDNEIPNWSEVYREPLEDAIAAQLDKGEVSLLYAARLLSECRALRERDALREARLRELETEVEMLRVDAKEGDILARREALLATEVEHRAEVSRLEMELSQCRAMAIHGRSNWPPRVALEHIIQHVCEVLGEEYGPLPCIPDEAAQIAHLRSIIGDLRAEIAALKAEHESGEPAAVMDRLFGPRTEDGDPPAVILPEPVPGPVISAPEPNEEDELEAEWITRLPKGETDPPAPEPGAYLGGSSGPVTQETDLPEPPKATARAKSSQANGSKGGRKPHANIEEALKLYQDGKSYGEITRATGVVQSSVTREAQRRGLPMRGSPECLTPPAAPLPPQEDPPAADFPPPDADPPDPPCRLTGQEVQMAVRLIADGQSDSDVCGRAGIPGMAASAWVRRRYAKQIAHARTLQGGSLDMYLVSVMRQVDHENSLSGSTGQVGKESVKSAPVIRERSTVALMANEPESDNLALLTDETKARLQEVRS